MPVQQGFRFTLTGYKDALADNIVPVGDKLDLNVSWEKQNGAEAGQKWTIPDINLDLMPIASGTFFMGSKNGQSNEQPVTQVTLQGPAMSRSLSI